MTRPLIHSLLAVALVLATAEASRAQSAAAANAAHGKALYLADGCYQCHGTQGEGGGRAGPSIAPDPIGLQYFTRQLRDPRDAMPVYTARVLSDDDLADVYAYLQSVPKAKPIADILLLNR